MDQVGRSIALSLVFALLGFVFLYVGYRVFDALTPTDLGQQIFEEKNVAAGVLAGAFVIGLGIIVAAAIS